MGFGDQFLGCSQDVLTNTPNRLGYENLSVVVSVMIGCERFYWLLEKGSDPLVKKEFVQLHIIQNICYLLCYKLIPVSIVCPFFLTRPSL